MEEWRDVAGYEGLYQVSDCGRVRRSGRCLKPVRTTSGYLAVTLSKEDRQRRLYVHRLVAAAFVSNDFGKPCVNHINGDKTDNRACNLEWCTYSENIAHAISSGLMDGSMAKAQRASANLKKRAVIRDDGEEYESMTEAALYTGCSVQAVSNVVYGYQKTTHGHSFALRDE